jgi:hypothetical protein
MSDSNAGWGYDQGKQYLEIFAALAAPFAPWEVKHRTQSGRSVPYVTARTISNRLDNVLGPVNWWDEYQPGEHSVNCRLTIRLPDGSTLTKQDAGGYAGMSDHGDDDKSGFSDALKRAAVKFGISRYLYGDGTPLFVSERYEFDQPTRQEGGARGERGSWGQQGQSQRPQQQAPARQQPERPEGQQYGDPKTGRALFAALKELEQRHEIALIKLVSDWAKQQDFPARMVDFSPEQVSAAYAEACRQLHSVQDGGEVYEEASSR